MSQGMEKKHSEERLKWWERVNPVYALQSPPAGEEDILTPPRAARGGGRRGLGGRG